MGFKQRFIKLIKGLCAKVVKFSEIPYSVQWNCTGEMYVCAFDKEIKIWKNDGKNISFIFSKLFRFYLYKKIFTNQCI